MVISIQRMSGLYIVGLRKRELVFLGGQVLRFVRCVSIKFMVQTMKKVLTIITLFLYIEGGKDCHDTRQ